MSAGFDQVGGDAPASPVVVSVPHAGRDYPAALLAALKVPLATIVGLEDRWVDAVAEAARRDETMLIQRRPRAWIDLNRGEDERDPRVDAGARPEPGRPSEKLRSGLGLVPARARFGAAVLLDLHSMPSLGRGKPRVVIGDRFGTAAAARFVARVEAEATACGVAINAPYAGGYVIRRHGDPANGMHAIQLELDRSLYLDARLDRPGQGLARTAALVRRILDALTDEAGASALPLAQAAE